MKSFGQFALFLWIASTLAAQTAGDWDPSFDPGIGPDGTVYALSIQPDGKLLVGGAFANWNNSPRPGLVRLNPDGSVDASFSPLTFLSSGGLVTAIATTSQGLIYAAGAFKVDGSLDQPAIVRILPTGALDPTFAPNRFINPVTALILDPNDRPIVGGSFSLAGSSPRFAITRLQPSGAIDPAFGPLLSALATQPRSPEVFSMEALALSPDGWLAGCGRNALTAGNRVQSLFWFSSSGLFDTSRPAFIASRMISLAFSSDGSLIAGGDKLYRFAASGAVDPGFAPVIENSSFGGVEVRCLSPDSMGRIIVGGAFNKVNGQSRTSLARLLADGSLDPRFSPATTLNGEIYAVSTDAQGRLLIGGTFTQVQGAPRARIARLTNPPLPPRVSSPLIDSTVSTGGNLRLHVDAEAEPGLTYQWLKDGVALEGETGPDLYLVDVTTPGRFEVRVSNKAGSASPPPVQITLAAHFDGAVDHSFNPDVTGAWNLIPRSDGRFYVGKGDTVKLLNLDGSADPAFNFETGALAGAKTPAGGAALPDGRLLLLSKSGSTGTVDRYLPDGRRDSTFSLRGLTNVDVAALVVRPDGTLMLGGRFSPSSSSEPARVFVKTDADGRYDPSFQPPTFAWPSQITQLVLLPNGSVMAQGTFSDAPLAAPRSLLRFQSDGSIDASWKPFDYGLRLQPNGQVYRVSPENSAITRLRSDGSDDPGFSCLPEQVLQRNGRQIIAVTHSVTLYPLSNGRLILVGDFGQINGAPAIGYARINADGSLDPAYTGPTFNTAGSAGFAEIGSQLYAFGDFAQIQGVARPGLARLFQDEQGSSSVVNLSARAHSDSAGNPLIAGFVLTGSAPRRVLIRGIGPALKGFGLADALAGARLELFRDTLSLGVNTGWSSGAPDLPAFAQSAGAFALPVGSADAALAPELPAGAYTAKITPTAGSGGTALAEVYVDGAAPSGASHLVNLSARAELRPGNTGLTAGFSLQGSGQKMMLIRVVGPTLADFGVDHVLPAPRLKLFGTNGQMAENSNWRTEDSGGFTAAAARKVGAFALAASGKDAAILRTLPAGSYTVTAESADATTGVVLIEIYEVSP